MSNRKKPGKRHLSLVDPRTTFAPQGLAQNVVIPDDEKVMLKEVPMKVDGTVVGRALLYDDGSVDAIIDEDAPQWAKDKISATAAEFAYSIGED